MIFFSPTITSIPGLQAALDAKASAAANDLKANLAGGNTWTGGQVITGSLACTSNIQIAGGTKTLDQPIVDLYENWNNSGVHFCGIKYNVTATAYGASSTLIDLQVGGSSVFKLTYAAGVPSVYTPNTTSEYLVGNAYLAVGSYAASNCKVGAGTSFNDALAFATSWGIKFSSTSNAIGTPDAGIHRNTIGVVEINNGTPGSYRDLRLRALLDTNGAQVVGTRGAAVADATDAASAITQLNAFLAIARTHGLIAT